MIKKLDSFLARCEDIFMAVGMGVATTLITLQVVMRYIMGDSLIWAEELAIYIIIGMCFVGTSMGVRCAAHISVDLVTSTVPPKIGRWINFAGASLGLIFGLCLLVYGWELTIGTMKKGQLSSAMRIPMYWVYAMIPFSGLLVVYRYASLAVRLITEKSLPDDSHIADKKDDIHRGQQL
jgi:C4-dicarboxylate transporter DctQ subunit